MIWPHQKNEVDTEQAIIIKTYWKAADWSVSWGVLQVLGVIKKSGTDKNGKWEVYGTGDVSSSDQ
jgi:hypothetical protein